MEAFQAAVAAFLAAAGCVAAFQAATTEDIQAPVVAFQPAVEAFQAAARCVAAFQAAAFQAAAAEAFFQAVG
jgi:hypothetical protein